MSVGRLSPALTFDVVTLHSTNSSIGNQPSSPVDFVPNASSCRPVDSVLLQIAAVPPYLDSALQSLGLHTEARTSFITFVSHRSFIVARLY